MNFLKIFILILLLPVVILAAQLERDDFITGFDGWTGSNIWHDSASLGWLGIDRDDYAEKTYTSLGNGKNVEINVALWVPNDWETSDDFNVFINGNLAYTYHPNDGYNQYTFLATTTASGELTLRFNPDTSQNSEDAYIDYVQINGLDPTLSISNFADTEGDAGNKTFLIPVTLSPTSASTVTVDYATSNNTAISGSDYTSSSGTLTFPPNSSTQYINVSVQGDTDSEVDETFSITLSNSGSTIISDNQATITIENDDAPPVNNGYRDFTLRKQLYLKGNMKTIGNTVLVPPNPNNDVCGTYTNGNYYTDVGTANNNWYLCGYQTDVGTTNSTTAALEIPSYAKVVWAGLYWQALVSNASFSTTMNIKIKKDNGSYNDISYDTLDYLADSGKVGYTSYAAFKDVTNYFTSNNWANGNYTVANIPVHEGKVDTLGTYGAWTMVVIYEDLTTQDEKFRSFSIFDGWKVVKDVDGYRDVPINVSGFYTPDRNDLNAAISVFAAEGDKHISNDYLKTTNYNTNNTVNLTPAGVNDQTFNSSISGSYYKLPNLTNNNGIDIQSYEIGDYLTPKQTEMAFHFTSDQDTYWPSLLAFNTELYEPKICYDFSYRQNGVELDITGDLGEKPNINTYLDDVPIEVGIYFRNKEADLAIKNLSFYTNLDSNTTNYVAYDLNSTYMSSVNGSVLEGAIQEVISNACDYNSSSTSPKVCTKDGNIRVGLGRLATGYSQISSGELGSEEYQFFQFNLNNTLTGKQNIDLNMSIDYYITPENGTPIPRLNRYLGQEIDICSEDTTYNPVWGIFNVADRGSSYYNLKTQVAKKPFNVDLQFFEKDASTGEYTDATPSKDINTSVIVEIFDVEPFHDVEAACANPTAHTSTPIYLNVNLSQNGSNLTQIPTQSSDYYNFAIKNAAFRVWHFNDQNGALIENFSIDGNGTSSNGLYNSSIHLDCIVKCNNAETSDTCYQCIKSKYATPVCSRDNFSIRPESFDIRVHDINQTTKDANSKIDLSALLNYTPDAGSAPTQRLNLATGYTTVYDINATNHTDLKATPWYVRTLNVSNTWDPQTVGLVCNDDSNYTFEIGFNANGLVTNKEYIQEQVGEYSMQLEDSAWTNVDVSKSHHISGYFDLSANSDCIQNSTTTAGSINGCLISTNHTNNDASHTYRNIDVTYKPYRFALPAITLPVFRYMSNVDNNASRVMSTNYNGNIEARGFDNTIPSNYVGGCYANDINITFNGNVELSTASYEARFIDFNSTNTAQDDFVLDINNSIDNNISSFIVTSDHFRRDNNGIINMNISMNYERNASTPINPLIVQLTKIDVNCTNIANCQINANLTSDFNITGTNDFVDANITHYYGRVHAPDQRFEGTNGVAQIYYEVYCDDCNKTLYNVSDTESIDSINWFKNLRHDLVTDGNVSVFDAVGNVRFGLNYPTATATSQTTAVLDGQEGQNVSIDAAPYTDKIDFTPSPWMIFNRFNQNATTDDFIVEFINTASDWAGEGSLGQTVDLNVSTRQNRRLDW